MTHTSRYARHEIERRWLVDPAAAASLAHGPARTIDDLYLTGTRMRLRKVTSKEDAPVFKFARKEPVPGSPYPSITNFYLSAQEYEVLARLGGCRVTKQRYRVAGGALDIYGAGRAPAVFETEFDSLESAAQFVAPSFVGEEITGDDAFSGASLAAALDTAAVGAGDELRHRISAGVLVEDGQERVLLVHCVREGVYDFWVAPGGGAIGTEDLLATAKREAFEECGLHVQAQTLAYVEEFHNPTTRFCKLWFTAKVTGGALDTTGRLATLEFITEAAFLSREEIAARMVFPALLGDAYWRDKAGGFASPRYVGIRPMAFW
ncbi:NUDIX domain-containing protein [Caenimonas aquaedulcis]|uniref:NUDIX domain-containing protein n=1 Tax=Caenimonas aquaedulcis TaxID=2793270 RepID=A0A931H4Q7_9BURK|nr:NUDIX domain-containing protein [Caenimonas aquaedulcis]MBG9388596.1 NUDIX domain-containing protein [Caenimonas aquaedulcis]